MAFLNLTKFFYYQYEKTSKVPSPEFATDPRGEKKYRYIDEFIRIREKFIELLEFAKLEKPLPPSSMDKYKLGVSNLIKEIEKKLGINHWVGGVNVTGKYDSLISPEEAELYLDLFIKAGHDAERVENLIEYERKAAPHSNRKELIMRAIDRWIKDNS